MTNPSSPTAFSWFPGHMRSAWRRLQQDLKLADAVLFLLDARAPQATRHPELEQSLSGRPVLLVLNKADLAEEVETERWLRHFKAQGAEAVALQARHGQGPGPLRPALARLAQAVSERRARRGIHERDLRLVVAGLPNVGKSTLLNRLVGRGAARTGKKAGLTRGQAQWVAGPEGWLVLDSPGITCPRIERERQLPLLAAVGCLKPDVLPLEDVAEELLALVEPQREPEPTRLESLGREKGFLLSGGRVDLDRAARWLLAASLEGRWGRRTLEPCP